MVDANGACSAEWYRFFAQIQRMIGGASDPFDDSMILAAGSSALAGIGGEGGDMLPAPTFVITDDVLVPPSIPAAFDDLLQPYPATALPLDGRAAYRTVTASANAELWDRVILVDTTAGAVTVTLPAVATCAGLVLNVKKIDGAANNMVIDGNGAETIDGAANITTATQWASYTVIATAAGWMIL